MSAPGEEKVLITISRQMGSGGSYIGRRVADRLGFRYMDRDILKEATEHLGESEEDLSFREEKVSGFLENLLKGFFFGSPEAAYIPPSIRPVYDDDLFRVESAIIGKVADRHDCVIVGRAGFQVLKARPGLASIFLHAPEDFRIGRVKEGYNLATRDEAADLIRRSDEQRRRFLERVAGVDWTDARCYHLCINTGVTGLPSAEDMVVELAEEIANRIGG